MMSSCFDSEASFISGDLVPSSGLREAGFSPSFGGAGIQSPSAQRYSPSGEKWAFQMKTMGRFQEVLEATRTVPHPLSVR